MIVTGKDQIHAAVHENGFEQLPRLSTDRSPPWPPRLVAAE